MIRLHRNILRAASVEARAIESILGFTSTMGSRLFHHRNHCFIAAPGIAAAAARNIVTSSISNRQSGLILWEQRRGKKKSAKEKHKAKKEKRKQNRRPGRLKKLEALYDEDENKYYLPAGTIVKHGTSTNNLRSILSHGVQPAFQQGRIGRTDITTNSDGVYVGSCYLAYRTSILNCFAGFTILCEDDSGVNIPILYNHPSLDENDTLAFLTQYRKRAMTRYVTPKKYHIDNCGLPVVLNITLKEDVYIEADEDYVDIRLESPAIAKEVWEQFGSTVLMQSIPARWISSVEFFEPHRPSSFVYEKFSLLEDYTSSSSGLLFNKIKADEDALHSASVHKYWKDLEALLLSEVCYDNRLDMNTRQKWHQEVVIPRQSFCVFSRQCDAKEESYELLDKLGENNNLEMLATGYQLCLNMTQGDILRTIKK
jgi:hypothetical protein